MTWQPIETAPLPVFDAKEWWRSSEYVLLYRFRVEIGNYSYTKNGKGRWRNTNGHNTEPTHWMPLPEPPK